MMSVVIYTKHAHQPVITFQCDRCLETDDFAAFYRGESQDNDKEVATFLLSELIGWVWVESTEAVPQ